MLGEEATLIVLAGGGSTRMGRPKHLLPTPCGTMVDLLHQRLSCLFAETLIVGRSHCFTSKGLRTVEDLRLTRSPLVGIYSGLSASHTGLCFVVACDMPFVNLQVVQHLLARAAGVDVVVPVVKGYYEPLCAAYRRTALRVIERAIDHMDLKVANIYGALRVCEVTERELVAFDPQLLSFVNLNTPTELHLLAPLTSPSGRLARHSRAIAGQAFFVPEGG